MSVEKINYTRHEDLTYIIQRTEAVSQSRLEQGDIVGFAVVVWGSDGGSTAELYTKNGSNIPVTLIPEFVKLRLLEQGILDWLNAEKRS